MLHHIQMLPVLPAPSKTEDAADCSASAHQDCIGIFKCRPVRDAYPVPLIHRAPLIDDQPGGDMQRLILHGPYPPAGQHLLQPSPAALIILPYQQLFSRPPVAQDDMDQLFLIQWV